METLRCCRILETGVVSVFDVAVAWYLFLAGAGSGSSLAAFCLDGFLIRRGAGRSDLRTAVAFGLAVGFALVAAGALFLLVDLGRPERALYVFTRPHLSVMSVGAFSIAAFLAASLAQLLVRVAFKPRVPAAVFAAIRWLCALAALSVLLYTGFLLESWGGVRFWGSCLLPALFAVSGLSCGLSVLQACCLLASGGRFDLPAWMQRRIARVDLALVAVEAALLAGYLLQMWYDSGASLAVAALVEGRLACCFWVGAVAIGLLLPLAANLLATTAKGVAIRAASTLCVLAGSFCLRYCILFAPFA